MQASRCSAQISARPSAGRRSVACAPAARLAIARVTASAVRRPVTREAHTTDAVDRARRRPLEAAIRNGVTGSLVVLAAIALALRLAHVTNVAAYERAHVVSGLDR